MPKKVIDLQLGKTSCMFGNAIKSVILWLQLKNLTMVVGCRPSLLHYCNLLKSVYFSYVMDLFCAMFKTMQFSRVKFRVELTVLL